MGSCRGPYTGPTRARQGHYREPHRGGVDLPAAGGSASAEPGAAATEAADGKGGTGAFASEASEVSLAEPPRAMSLYPPAEPVARCSLPPGSFELYLPGGPSEYYEQR